MPAEPSANPAPRQGGIWRVVEAQHRVSTMKLVDSPEEQATLEELIDATKPPVPAECRHLHWLLFTPFRYEARSDSRFRRRGKTPPVFYASEHAGTAVAEIAFWRLLFFIESPGTSFPVNPLELTAFSVRYHAALCLDLTRTPYTERSSLWRHPTDYSHSHAIADEARRMGCDAIRSSSARDPDEGCNLSLLTCTAFLDTRPRTQHRWDLRLHSAGISASRASPPASLHFDREAFARDPRVAAFDWQR